MAWHGKARPTNKPSIVDKRKSIENYPNWNLSEGGGGAGRSWKNKGKRDRLSLFACRFVVFPPLCNKVRRVVHHLPSPPFLPKNILRTSHKISSNIYAHTTTPHLLSISLSQKL
jgi:hypothetical protein